MGNYMVSAGRLFSTAYAVARHAGVDPETAHTIARAMREAIVTDAQPLERGRTDGFSWLEVER